MIGMCSIMSIRLGWLRVRGLGFRVYGFGKMVVRS